MTHLALTVGPSPLDDVSDDELAALWFEHRDKLIAEASEVTTLWALWHFSEDVPDDLRAERPQLVVVAADEASPSPDRDAERLLRLRRRAWLERTEAA